MQPSPKSNVWPVARLIACTNSYPYMGRTSIKRRMSISRTPLRNAGFVRCFALAELYLKLRGTATPFAAHRQAACPAIPATNSWISFSDGVGPLDRLIQPAPIPSTFIVPSGAPHSAAMAHATDRGRSRRYPPCRESLPPPKRYHSLPADTHTTSPDGGAQPVPPAEVPASAEVIDRVEGVNQAE